MATNCAPSCYTCHLIDIQTRCPALVDADPALRPGELNKMFERIVQTAPGNRTLTEIERKELLESGMTEYSVQVHSQPSNLPATETSAVLDKSLPPWVITFENFLTPEECQALIDLGHEYVYERSEDVGEIKFDGSHDGVQSESRTSENAWCSNFAGCRKREMPTLIHDRMSKVMEIPANNSEDFQLLKYEVGQFYKTHHDFIPHQLERQCGPRILTFFLYLSDAGGGGTNFPRLNMTIEPKQGRALLWPSVYDSDPLKMDPRMYHQALEVKEGTKFAANGWIHMYDYITVQADGCN
jgi:prolyl 4-hydroxylase